MSTKIKIYIAVGIAILIYITGYSLWSSHQLSMLETTADEVKQKAEIHEQRANELEMSARKYEEKIAYLEPKLVELQALATKQNEELKSIEINTRNARGFVERARRIRPAAATAAEVCRKLAELRHGCQ